MNISGVYRIRNIVNGKIYVGSSSNFYGREKAHRHELKRGRHHSSHLQNAWNKYGAESFVWEMVEHCDAVREKLLEREQHYLDTLKPEYNVLTTAGSRLGCKHTQKTCEKISKANVGKKHSDETKAKLREINLNMSDETKAKMAAAKLGTTKSDETRQRMSEAHKGRPKKPEAIELTIQKRHEKRLQRVADATAALASQTLIKNDVRRTLRRLSDDQVRAIRNSTAFSKDLAVVYGITDSAINKIRRGLVYKDIV